MSQTAHSSQKRLVLLVVIVVVILAAVLSPSIGAIFRWVVKSHSHYKTISFELPFMWSEDVDANRDRPPNWIKPGYTLFTVLDDRV